MDFMTIVSGLIALWIAAKLIPPILEGWQRGCEQRETRELLRQHPEHAYEIKQAARVQQARWTPAPEIKKGGAMGKAVVIVLCIVYIVCPIDFIPDVIPVLGWGDDVMAAIIGLKAMLK